MTYIVFMMMSALHICHVLGGCEYRCCDIGCTSGGTELLPFAVAFNEETTVSLDTVLSVGPQINAAAAQYLGAVMHSLPLFFQTERHLWYH